MDSRPGTFLHQALLVTRFLPLALALGILPSIGEGAADDAASTTPAPRFDNPSWSPDGRWLAYSDADHDALYLLDTQTNTTWRIAESPSAGYACSWSPDGMRLGFKLLIAGGASPLQMPVYYDVPARRLVSLHPPVRRAGVPSFFPDGRIAVMIDQELRILKASGVLERAYALGHYANLTPVSPDGTRVAFNGEDDQIWIMDLTTGLQRQITPEGESYFAPAWSPDARRLVVSTISAQLKVIDASSGETYDLGPGETPSWDPDSETVYHVRIERAEGVRVTRAEIRSVRYDGADLRSLTQEDAQQSTSARVSPNGVRIAFVSTTDGEIYQAPLVPAELAVPGAAGVQRNTFAPNASPRNTIGAAARISGSGAAMEIAGEINLAPGVTPAEAAAQVVLTRSVPYIHQVYDTTNAFNGHWACGATSAMMAISYYEKLPWWNITCSWPYSHTSHHGQYISEIYSYNGHTYNFGSPAPDGDIAYGGYGFIVRNNWKDTKGYMADYLTRHGINSSVDWSPTWAKLQTEINNQYPFVVLNSLTTSGHYITTIGYFPSQRTAVFNDPYGNKNTPGYPSYDGAGACYDWPGYNNGYQNLNTVHCFIYARSTPPVQPPTITQHPNDQNTCLGSTVSMSVAATGGGTLAYRWQKNTVNMSNGGHYSGVTTTTLTISDVSVADAASYRCVVSNAGGNATSNAGTLTLKSLVPADFDCDGDVDDADAASLLACMAGAGIRAAAGCELEDLDDDADVDQIDFGRFQRCLRGAFVPADADCLD